MGLLLQRRKSKWCLPICKPASTKRRDARMESSILDRGGHWLCPLVHRKQHHYSNPNSREQHPEQHENSTFNVTLSATPKPPTWYPTAPKVHPEQHPLSNTKAQTVASTGSSLVRSQNTCSCRYLGNNGDTPIETRDKKVKPTSIKQRSFFMNVHWLSTWSCKSLPAKKNTRCVLYYL